MTNDFEQALRAHGLVPRGAVVPDGKIHHCPTDSHPHRRNGRYMLALDGEFGWFQDWAAESDPVIWRADRGAGEATTRQVDTTEIRRRQREERRRRWRASEDARAFYASCRELRGGHAYLEAHGLDMAGCRGLRIDREGWLVVPMVRGEQIVSVQRIAPDGQKRFWPGASTSG